MIRETTFPDRFFTAVWTINRTTWFQSVSSGQGAGRFRLIVPLFSILLAHLIQTTTRFARMVWLRIAKWFGSPSQVQQRYSHSGWVRKPACVCRA